MRVTSSKFSKNHIKYVYSIRGFYTCLEDQCPWKQVFLHFALLLFSIIVVPAAV